MAKGTLYLIPVPLGKTAHNNSLAPHTLEVIRKIEVFAVENLQSATRFLQWVGETVPTYKVEFYPLHKGTPANEIFDILTPLKKGKDVGILSEAGCPGIADPGAKLVSMAHQQEIPVVPLVGPSSILLAQMGSGFNGQSFSFNGYLPIQSKERIKAIQKFENESIGNDRSQIFIEAPHRNQELVVDILKHARPDTQLCIAANLTLENEFLQSKTVQEWNRSTVPDLNKIPAIFIIYSGKV